MGVASWIIIPESPLSYFSRAPNLLVPKIPNLFVPKFPDALVLRFPDALVLKLPSGFSFPSSLTDSRSQAPAWERTNIRDRFGSGSLFQPIYSFIAYSPSRLITNFSQTLLYWASSGTALMSMISLQKGRWSSLVLWLPYI